MIAHVRRPARRRPGFTLVELMVSAAVSVIIMATLATVFQTGIDTMRQMKSVASLQDQLRAATTIIRRDLQANHFVPAPTKNAAGQLTMGPRLSDQWLNDPSWKAPPAGGFFHVESNAAWAPTTGTDADGLTFGTTYNFNTTVTGGVTSKNTGFLLHFTSILPGDQQQNAYSAVTAAGTAAVSSPAAEIAYFLDDFNTGGIDTGSGSVPLFQLIRRQRLVAQNNAALSTFPNFAATELGVVAMPTAGGKPPYTLAQMATANGAGFRLGGASTVRSQPAATAPQNVNLAAMTGTAAGDDVLLSNVIAFEIKANWDGGTSAPRKFSPNIATDDPYDFLITSGNAKFDTGNPGAKVRIKALQIRIRVFDQQLKTTRQVTIVQDM